MKVSLDLSALHGIQWHQYALRFALGGLVTMATGGLAKWLGPQWGGLFLAFPAIFPAAATLIARREREKKARKGMDGRRRGKQVAALDAAGAVLGSIGLIVFAVCLWQGLTRYPWGLVLACASVLWFGLSFALWFYWRHRSHRVVRGESGS
jgi:uncharacterized protein DUF3147